MYIWLRVRPWTVIICAPRSCAIRASSGAFRLVTSQPIRILTVTGTSTARTTASISRAASGKSRISAEPASPLTTFFTGQPMLISMIAAPRSAFSRAASAISRGTHPASCSDTGSSAASHADFCSDWRVSRIIAGLAIISVTFSPEPKWRTSLRNGMSVTPVIGARITGQSTATGPIRIGANCGRGGSRLVTSFMLIQLPKKQAAHIGLPQPRQAITSSAYEHPSPFSRFFA